mmetsp:Transcript_75705/g.149633  ORF Transcript_75705/g.149633 Transcript_75705/m.149633 type:complete len:230 (+) Transcript_75705:508-1197(+)
MCAIAKSPKGTARYSISQSTSPNEYTSVSSLGALPLSSSGANQLTGQVPYLEITSCMLRAFLFGCPASRVEREARQPHRHQEVPIRAILAVISEPTCTSSTLTEHRAPQARFFSARNFNASQRPMLICNSSRKPNGRRLPSGNVAWIHSNRSRLSREASYTSARAAPLSTPGSEGRSVMPRSVPILGCRDVASNSTSCAQSRATISGILPLPAVKLSPTQPASRHWGRA